MNEVSIRHIGTTDAYSSCVIVEGIDNVGKGTLIDGIIDRIGFHQVIKFDKPKRSEFYGGSLKKYQQASFKTGFSLARSCILSGVPVIFDRFHLGELVYSPIYRGYSGDYVFEEEKAFFGQLPANRVPQVKLILLRANDPSKLPDDGKSFDPKKIGIEQDLFMDAFERSCLPKLDVEVQGPSGEFLPKEEVLEQALSFLKL